MRADLLLTILAVFGPLSFATIGGGQGIMPELHRQAVVQQHWISEQQFVFDFAISRLSPGPGSLLVTLIGWQAAGWAGALVASVAIFLPSSLLLYGLARLWAHYRDRPWQRAVERGLAPVAAGLILAGSLTVLEAQRRRLARLGRCRALDVRAQPHPGFALPHAGRGRARVPRDNVSAPAALYWANPTW